MAVSQGTRYVRWFDTLGIDDVPLVGGKNASVGEMMRALGARGIAVPQGFALTAEAYWRLLEEAGLRAAIEARLQDYQAGRASLQEAGESIRRLIMRAPLPAQVEEELLQAYAELSRRYGKDEVDVAVRSSATAEDLPQASFAGQHDSFLNVCGAGELRDAVRRCLASLFNDRAIVYRQEKGFAHLRVALSVGVQKMVRADLACAGVMFSVDTETGFPRVVVIDGAWGLGENVVQGQVNPDEFVVFKPLLADPRWRPIIGKTLGTKERKVVYGAGGTRATRNVQTTLAERESFVLSDDEVLQLARWAVAVEEHYGRPMDMEWAKDGPSGQLFMLQARPETVQSRREAQFLKTYELKGSGPVLARGLAIGEAIAAGRANLIKSVHEMNRFEDNAVLVTAMTDPDWVPVMKRAAAIVTDHGGRTSHAAIVSRELGVPAIVGTMNATQVLLHGQEITVSCAEGEEGRVYDGLIPFEARDMDLSQLPATRTAIMMNMGDPAAALRWWRLPCRGIGLARMEFIISNIIKIHPMALAHFDRVTDEVDRRLIVSLTRGYADMTDYFVDHLARGIARLAASQHPHPVIVRTSDFKSNEYANLIGGRAFEPRESNPMLGLRGASRYYSDLYRDGFALECRAIKKVREEMGLENVVVMIPFCRTVEEAQRVLEVMAANGLVRGEKGLEVYVMCEIPSNVVLAEQFAQYFDGFSIGSNDLTMLVLGVDRESSELAHLFDERNEAVRRMIRQVIEVAHAAGRKVGICGQAPSDYPEFAAFLVEAGIDSISLNPDSVLAVIPRVARAERDLSP